MQTQVLCFVHLLQVKCFIVTEGDAILKQNTSKILG